jgi:hypothetical protein
MKKIILLVSIFSLMATTASAKTLVLWSLRCVTSAADIGEASSTPEDDVILKINGNEYWVDEMSSGDEVDLSFIPPYNFVAVVFLELIDHDSMSSDDPLGGFLIRAATGVWHTETLSGSGSEYVLTYRVD